jgi:hypothetical protein
MSTDLTKAHQELMKKPDFLKDQEPLGVDNLKEFIRPPRIKIIQPQTKAPLSEMFDKGDVILLPQSQVISPVMKKDNGKPSDQGEPFWFIPLFFFPEWCVWNPIQMKGTLPAIRERTFDVQSKIAHRARVKELWYEKCPENPEYNIRYCEHLNFIIMFTGKDTHLPLRGTTAVLSYSRGGWRAGSTLLSLIQTRDASIFDCVFEGRANLASNEKGEWYIINATNPSRDSGVDPWVRDKDIHKKLMDMHIELKEAHAKSMIVVDFDEEEEEEVGTGKF